MANHRLAMRSRHPVTRHDSWSRLVAEPRPSGTRDGAIRIDIDTTPPKRCGAIHVENFDERAIVTAATSAAASPEGQARIWRMRCEPYTHFIGQRSHLQIFRDAAEPWSRGCA